MTAARKLAFRPRLARRLTQEQLARVVLFPQVRERISSALARARDVKADIPAGGRLVRFRIDDPAKYHQALFSTIPVGTRGTQLLIGTRKDQIRDLRKLNAFLARVGWRPKAGRPLQGSWKRPIGDRERRDLAYKLRSAGLIGGARTQSVRVPRERVERVVWEYLRAPEARRAAAANREALPGGHAAGMRPSQFDPRQLKIGTMHEYEHGPSKRIAREIAMDHLAEHPDYYRRLRKAGLNPPAFFVIDPQTNVILGLFKGDPAKTFNRAADLAKAAARKLGRAIMTVPHPYTPKGFRVGTEVSGLFARPGAAGVAMWGPQGTMGNRARRNPILATLGILPNPKRTEYPSTKWMRAFVSAYAKYGGHTGSRTLQVARNKAVELYRLGATPPAAAKAIVEQIRLYGSARDWKELAGYPENPKRNPILATLGIGNPPPTIGIPFRDGETIAPGRMRKWVASLPPGPVKSALSNRFEASMRQYRRFHQGAEPRSFLYKKVPMGASKAVTDVDFVVSEGKEFAAPYQVPKHSGKWRADVDGRYVHAHGESGVDVTVARPRDRSKLPERFHTADGKFVGVLPSRNVRITDWYRG